MRAPRGEILMHRKKSQPEKTTNRDNQWLSLFSKPSSPKFGDHAFAPPAPAASYPHMESLESRDPRSSTAGHFPPTVSVSIVLIDSVGGSYIVVTLPEKENDQRRNNLLLLAQNGNRLKPSSSGVPSIVPVNSLDTYSRTALLRAARFVPVGRLLRHYVPVPGKCGEISGINRHYLVEGPCLGLKR